jgi:hypothetical protein
MCAVKSSLIQQVRVLPRLRSSRPGSYAVAKATKRSESGRVQTTSGQRQWGSGERDDLGYRRADSAGPAAGQWKRTELLGTGHDQPPGGIQG